MLNEVGAREQWRVLTEGLGGRRVDTCGQGGTGEPETF